MLFTSNRISVRDKYLCRVFRGFYESRAVLVPVQDGVYHAPQHCLAVARGNAFRQAHGIQFIFVFRKECQRLIHLLVRPNRIENPDSRRQRIAEHLLTDIVRWVHQNIYCNPVVIEVEAWVALDAVLCDTLRYGSVLFHSIDAPLYAAFIEVKGRCYILFLRRVDVRKTF